jgi:hypothetical protein
LHTDVRFFTMRRTPVSLSPLNKPMEYMKLHKMTQLVIFLLWRGSPTSDASDAHTKARCDSRSGSFVFRCVTRQAVPTR